MSNPIGALQERFQGSGTLPIYEEAGVVGQSHAPHFAIKVNHRIILINNVSNLVLTKQSNLHLIDRHQFPW